MSDEAFKVWQLGLAAWCKFVGGVLNDGKTSGLCGDVVSDAVLLGVRRDDEDRRAYPMKPERYGITRHADFENVLEVDFSHFRTVRDVRARVHGERRSPLAGREVKP